MNREKFNFLKEIYVEDENLVMIADKDWNVLWSNQETKIKNIMDVVEVSPDDWKTDKISLPEKGIRYTFRHLKQEKIHLVTCEDDPLKLLLPVMKVASAAAHTQATICHDVYDILEDLPEGDDLTLIGALSGNCYRMQRIAHVLRQIYELESNIAETVCFSVSTQLNDVFNSMKRMYRTYMSMDCELETRNLFINANREAFVTAILAGMSISFLEPDKFQRVFMNLSETEQNTALVKITVVPEMENEQPDRRLQVKDFDAIANDREYLDIFCRRYDCQWKMEKEESEEENKVVFSMEMPLCEQPKNITLHLNSLSDDFHFNAYTAMLSILHYRLIM